MISQFNLRLSCSNQPAEQIETRPWQRGMHGIKLNDDVADLLELVYPAQDFHPNRWWIRLPLEYGSVTRRYLVNVDKPSATPAV